MKIHGLQKMTLLDYPGYVACTVFLGGCDFRCPYCHNFELACGAAQPVMDDEELFAFLKRRKGLLDGVAITGGEPCLHKDLPELLREIRALGFRTKLDTNGYHPEMLRHVLEEGLVDYVAMDIKNSPAKYAETAGFRYFSVDESADSSDTSINTDEDDSHTGSALASPGTRTVSSPYTSGDLTHRILDLGKIRKSISLLINGAVDYEFRTTVVKEFHTAEDFFEIGEMICGADHYYLQCFTDRDTVPYGNLHAPSVEALQKYWRIMLDFVPGTELRGINEPA
ncbi:MAG: anaerobic ribonucleoside-triphosphate reductase activating protein [Eubacterium sp.]|nr:anaerobic ribonucleoside-triphosphate reductase activating protein [Eubacterium sp.]